MPRFVDRVVIHAKAGNGGHGCASVHREKFKPLGGPDGGNGGSGGSIVLVVDPQVHTLLDFHFHPHVDAPSGKPGAGNNREGANGADLELRVPDGTVVLDEHGKLLADLVGAGTRFDAAAGGRGGLGNAALASRARKAPGFALLGEKGETRDLTLELKTVADVGLVGFPSAGKSSLVSVISAAKPKIADYPFTTLAPNLGVVSAGEHTFTVADVPGLIPGASEGRGLGLDFLRHIERCAVLVHVVDCATMDPGRDPISDIDALEAELAAYTPTLQGDSTLGRPRRPAKSRGAQQDRRAGCARTGRVRSRRGSAALRVASVRSVGGQSRRTAAVDVCAVGHRLGLSGRAARRRAASSGDPTDCRRTKVASRSCPTATVASSCAGHGPNAGSARPISRTTKRSATSATGWPGSGWKTNCSSSARSPAVPSPSVTSRSIGSRRRLRVSTSRCPGAAPTSGWSRPIASAPTSARPHERRVGSPTATE